MTRRALGLLVAALVLVPQAVFAQTTVEFRQRCATRLSSNIIGQSPSATLFSSADPQASVDAMLATPEFIERLSRFVNASFNVDLGDTPAEDASYYLTKFILQNNRPWRDLFLGAFRVDPGASATADAVVVADANGLGYFRSRVWMVRYAGNELAGYRINAAYRMFQNVIGVKMQAAQNTDGVDAAGRMSPACAGCHYNSLFGLDLAAKILSRRVGTGAAMTFAAPNEGPQMLLGGISVADDKSFITAMVNSQEFRFRACRIATEFLYARREFKCEGPAFDKCMAAFSTAGTMQSAVAAIAKDPSYCQ